METPFFPMGVFGILRAGLKIPSKNGKIFLSVALLLLIQSSIIYLTSDFAIKPLIMDLAMRSLTLQNIDPQQPSYAKLIDGIKKDIGILAGEETIILVVSAIVSLFVAVATIYTSAMTYHGKDLTCSELFRRIRWTWKRPVITWLCITLFNLGFLLLIILLLGFLMLIAKGSIISTCLVIVLALLSLCFYVYFTLLFILGIVISVIEEGSYGMGALAKAAVLIKGRRWQGCILYVLFSLLGSAIYLVLNLAIQDIHLSNMSRLVIGIVLVNVLSLETILIYMVFTVFYFECKKSHGENVEIEGESEYSLVPTAFVEDSLP
ncbi:uncharacterized protein LOC131256448 [Magnolia sinica]|uniref:uncharacterized protein LOC131256448 n=1 Tax=Magnolia sinica TaxID=86752 RepID=UPI00265ACC3F|nr:uncharacterized protein LOC131256448 [Magnolia sinica]